MPLLGPLVAYLPTPRGPEGEVRTDPLEELVDRAVRAGASGVAVLGSTGGYPYLTAGERRSVVEAGVAAADGRVPVVAGVGAFTTDEVVVHTIVAERSGAAAVLLPTLAYLPLTDAEVLDLVRDVADAARVPVWLYHNPVSTSFRYEVDTLARAAQVPGVGGVKDRGSDPAELRDRVRALTGAVPAHVELGCSGDVIGVEGLLAGARTWHTGLGGVLPEWYVAVAGAAADGRADEARALMARLAPVAELVASLGGPRAVHAVSALRGVDVGDLPAPLHPVDRDGVAALDRALSTLGDPPPPTPGSGPAQTQTRAPRPAPAPDPDAEP
ncbi:dihydrodipicolinate synthase family protein [Cellulomonas hominis]|uniref:4-hydroxy-tetrahydrodipicolinate synthase n=1 Tax=Cellulomonas hominis TaxID=156981 RepID=A0A511FA63_9CELL|nr:dihydrodipicolinate synthase family protein [Cellulomonas hominis]MBB5475365.1 4-hydroxy-tetrahydrodipicolinate synthase [Cellulomonas hominis]GEL46123.1 dihydrodipicolinate synthase family protein [Cellulomonas hominis]